MSNRSAMNSPTSSPSASVNWKVGVASLVISSLSLKPKSDPSTRSGLEGMSGITVSMIMSMEPDTGEVFPAGSVAVTVTE